VEYQVQFKHVPTDSEMYVAAVTAINSGQQIESCPTSLS